ncbi:threonylcarbamoyl-AMP synthase [Ambystoma mexicanum]|uniref:threonylcarbamoyl-AMP synthase n=1 Tax=Ambystoma mexicanum TaxID=8296 RepID=UPI0037E98788
MRAALAAAVRLPFTLAALNGCSASTVAPVCKEGCRLLTLPGGGAGVPNGLCGQHTHSAAGWSSIVHTTARVLQEGGVVGVPTDTIYGLACLAQNSQSIKNMYSVKGRNGSKPLAICVGNIEDIYRYCHVGVPDQLLQDLLPGPVTLVFERSDALNPDLNPFTSLVGVRIPDHAFIRQLSQACSEPLALTSANISSQTSTLMVQEFQDLWPQLSLVVDGGPVGDLMSPQCRLGSTVVDLSVSGKYTVIRPGCALKHTAEILGKKYGLTTDS